MKGQRIGYDRRWPGRYFLIAWVKFARAIHALRETGKFIDDTLLQYLSPLGWEHFNLTGDYVWRQSRKIEDGQFRPLRIMEKA